MWYYAQIMTRCCVNSSPPPSPPAPPAPPIAPPPTPIIEPQPCPYPDLPTLNPSLIRDDGTYIA